MKTTPPKSTKKGQLKIAEPTSPTDVTMESGIVSAGVMEAVEDISSLLGLANSSQPRNPGIQVEPVNTMQLILEEAGMKPPPQQPKKPTPNCFYSFELIGDKGDKHFKESRDALTFKQDFPDMILKEHKFTTFLRFTNHIKRCNARAAVAPTVARRTAAQVDEVNDDASNRIAALLAEQRPVDHLMMKYKTNSTCTTVYGTLTAMTMWQTAFWGFKPAQLAPVLKTYSTVIPHPDMHIQEALQNMSFGKARDTDSADRNLAKVVNYTPPGKKDVIVIEVFTMYTWFTIPYATMNTTTEEGIWIQGKCERLVEEIRRIMQTSVFKTVLSKMGNTLFFEKLFDPKRKSNLPKFLSGCSVRVEECEVFTDEVIQEVSNKMVMGMYETSLPMRKYPELNLEGDFAAEGDGEHVGEPDEAETAQI